MKKTPVFPLIVLALVAGFAGAWIFKIAGGAQQSQAKTESAYERVMRTGTLRCGYVMWPPYLIKDPNNGQYSGVFHDYTEALGKALNLKVEWTEEEGWGDYPAALNAGRIDAMCGGSLPNSARARQIDFVRPILYQPVYIYARMDDKRFDNNIDAIDDPSVTIIVVEGTTSPVIATQDFPKAKLLQLPETTSLADTFVSLADGKADVAMQSPMVEQQYEIHNPGKIRRVEAKYPLRLFGNSIAIAGGEERLRRMLDLATDEMIYGGQIDKIVARYDHVPGSMLRIAQPYEADRTIP